MEILIIIIRIILLCQCLFWIDLLIKLMEIDKINIINQTINMNMNKHKAIIKILTIVDYKENKKI